MKHFYIILSVCLLFFYSRINGQLIIFEKFLGEESNNSKVSLNFNNQNYDVHQINSHKNLYIFKDNLNNTNQNKGINEEVVVTINLGNYAGQFIVILVFDENGYEKLVQSNQNTVEFNLPNGNYDFIVSVNDTPHKLIIKELVEVNENMTLFFDILDAKNRIVYDSYDDSGELIVPGGNNLFGIVNGGVVFNPIKQNFFNMGASWFDNPMPGHLPQYYISDVSDRYGIFYSSISQGLNEKIYVTEHESQNGVTDHVFRSNDSNTWISYEENAIIPTLCSTENNPVNYSGLEFKTSHDGFDTNITVQVSISEFDQSKKFEYMFNPETDSTNKTLISQILFSENWDNQGMTLGSIMTVDPENIIYSSGRLNFSEFSASQYFYRNMNEFMSFPFHDKLSFATADNQNINQGGAVPIINTLLMPNFNLKTNFPGRFGEVSESNYLCTEAEVLQNSTLVFSGYLNEIQSHLLYPNGEKTVNLTNKNVLIDDIEGVNKTQLIYGNNSQDYHPPTLQMLQFRNEMGRVKDIFSAEEVGVIRIAAGDFYYDVVTQYYTYIDGNEVELFYSKLNEDSWTELELIEYPEHFSMPRFGDYYEASLAGIVPEGNDVWYDVKVICTDAAGNKQIQTISPAFKLNNTLQTDEIGEEYDFVVYPNPFNENLNILIPKNIKGDYVVKLTDMTGKIISSENKKATDSKSLFFSFLPKGVYVLSIESNGKILAKKVIKK